MKKILIINRAQFGLHTDSFKYTKYLKEQYEVTYLGFDNAAPLIEEEGVDVIYVPRDGNFLVRLYRFLKTAIKEIKSNKYNFAFVVYFPLCFLLSLIGKNNHLKMICDIRTLSVHKNKFSRMIFDSILKLELFFFKYKTIISAGVAKKLKLKEHDFNILPLGGEPLVAECHLSNLGLNLFYLGTFNGRKIEESIKGFAIFLSEAEDDVRQNSTYNIVGFGSQEEENALNSATVYHDLQGKVKLHGRLAHSDCAGIIENSNVGVCYYPRNDFFEHQPPTKLFEYILSGLPCISVSTSETIKYITEENGVLIEDSPESFANGLQIMLEKMPYKTKCIKKSLLDLTWKKIVNEKLVPILEKLDD
jgi:glycosyltransferase involved in cell wall biosynthesis